jgi:translation initiation factor 2 alpha subunit (eIF-2alpha)
LLKTWKYRKCAQEFFSGKLKEYHDVQAMAMPQMQKDVEKLLADLNLKFIDEYDRKYHWIEKCHKLGEFIVTDIYSNPNS